MMWKNEKTEKRNQSSEIKDKSRIMDGAEG